MKKSLADIEKEFREIALSQNITGDSVEAIIKMLSYNRYEAMTSVDNTLLEMNADTAVNRNSQISHAEDQMYSLGRGVNSKLKVMATVTGNVNINKYENVYSDRENNLFFLSAKLNGEDIQGGYNFMYGQTYELTLIKADKIYEEIISVGSDNKYMIELLDSSISETYTLKDDVDEIPTIKDFGTHIDSSIELENVAYKPLAFDLTIPDYGLRVYAPDSNGFNPSVNYSLKYVKFMDESIEIDNSNKLTIPGFKLDLNSIKIVHRVPRESSSNFLYNIRREMVTQSRVRSNEDPVNLFKKYFPLDIKDASMNAYDLVEDKITINYIPILSNDLIEPFDDVSQIDNIEMEVYLSKLMYYVTKNIVQIPIRDSQAIKLGMDLSIVISEVIDTQEVIKVVSQYEYKLGKKFLKDEFMGDINDIPGVKYCSLKVTLINELNEEVEIESIEAPINSYLLISPTFNYTYRR